MKDYTGILFLDCETVPVVEHFEELDERLQLLFKKKFKKDIDVIHDRRLVYKPGDQSISEYSEMVEKGAMNELWNSNAALHAEFGKVVCVSVGTFVREGGKITGEQKFHVKAITDTFEHVALSEFKEAVKKTNPSKIVTHNGKNFDIPFLCRRNIINAGSPMPCIINPIGKKPWEIQHDDTMEMWGFGEWGKKTSLDLIAATLDIPSPKEIMDGSQVAYYYYEHDRFNGSGHPEIEEPFSKGIDKIGQYCNGDVITLAKVYLRLCGDLDEVVLLNQ